MNSYGAQFQKYLTAKGYTLQQCFNPGRFDFFQNITIQQPEFFKTNLLSEYRVIRHLQSDPHNNIRVFYFQLLKSCFDVPNFSSPAVRNFANLVFQDEFQILFTPETDQNRDVFNDRQFKKLFAMFLQLISSNKRHPHQNSLQSIINSYPIIDAVMIHTFRTLLLRAGIGDRFDQLIPCRMVFKNLSSICGVALNLFGKCFQFEQADLFCYVDSEESLFMSYLMCPLQYEAIHPVHILQIPQEDEKYQSESACETDRRNNSQSVDPRLQIQKYAEQENFESPLAYCNSTKEGSESGRSRNCPMQNKDNPSYLQGLFQSKQQRDVDVLYRKSTNKTTSISSPIKQELSWEGESSGFRQPQMQTPLNPDFINGFQNMHLNLKETQSILSNPDSTQQVLPVEVKSSKFEHFLSDGCYSNNSTAASYDNSPLSAWVQYNIVDTDPIKSNFPESANQPTGRRDYLGDYYEDFTNTFILQHLDEPHRSGVRKIKNNMRGLRKPVGSSQLFY